MFVLQYEPNIVNESHLQAIRGPCTASNTILHPPKPKIVVVFVAVLRTQRLWHGVLLLCLFPLSIVLVAGLEGAGLD